MAMIEKFAPSLALTLLIWGRKGFDWIKKLKRARQRAAWLCKNAETFKCQY